MGTLNEEDPCFFKFPAAGEAQSRNISSIVERNFLYKKKGLSGIIKLRYHSDAASILIVLLFPVSPSSVFSKKYTIRKL